ncbi:hypothetical protein KQR54_18300 [Mycobacterium gordonae]|nr:hypothetical protein [Mycobacterium gordonae]
MDRSSNCKECNSRYYEENRDKIAAYKTNYYMVNRERENARVLRWLIDNREQVLPHRRCYKRNWRRANPEKTALEKHTRRARKSALPDTLTYAQINETLAYFNAGCALTGDEGFQWDHVIPLASGSGGTTHGNMIPLRSDLNASKNDSNVFEWFAANKQRFALSQERFDSLISWLSEVNGMTPEMYRDYVYGCHKTETLAA